jgi:hypothetical protein
MGDLLVDVVSDGHTAVRFLMLTATMIATACLMLSAHDKKKPAGGEPRG